MMTNRCRMGRALIRACRGNNSDRSRVDWSRDKGYARVVIRSVTRHVCQLSCSLISARTVEIWAAAETELIGKADGKQSICLSLRSCFRTIVAWSTLITIERPTNYEVK